MRGATRDTVSTAACGTLLSSRPLATCSPATCLHPTDCAPRHASHKINYPPLHSPAAARVHWPHCQRCDHHRPDRVPVVRPQAGALASSLRGCVPRARQPPGLWLSRPCRAFELSRIAAAPQRKCWGAHAPPGSTSHAAPTATQAIMRNQALKPAGASVVTIPSFKVGTASRSAGAHDPACQAHESAATSTFPEELARRPQAPHPPASTCPPCPVAPHRTPKTTT